jgi:hypothetical protein
LRGEFRAAREIAQAYLRQAEVEGRPEHAVAAHRMLGTVTFELGAFSESREEFERCYRDAFEPRICWDFKHLRPTGFKWDIVRRSPSSRTPLIHERIHQVRHRRR